MTAPSLPASWTWPLWRQRATTAGDTGDATGVDVVDRVEPIGPAMITVRRTADDDVRDRQVYLSIDGEEWATIYYGQTVSRELTPGRHTLKANNTLVRKSVEFDVAPGGHIRYQCINKAHWTAMVFMAFLGAAFLTVRLVREQEPPATP